MTIYRRSDMRLMANMIIDIIIMLFVFASLVKDGLLSIEELSGLDVQKLAKVKAMARM